MHISQTSSLNIPFTFRALNRKLDKEALADSGATENFMDWQVVLQLGLGTSKMEKAIRIFNVDGTENRAGTLKNYVLLRIRQGDKEELQQFYVTNLGQARTILGYPWFKAFNPEIDWAKGMMTGPQIEIETPKHQDYQEWKHA
jgi:hypothetical protein